MRYAEITDYVLEPTATFKCFHGNYCGPGNRGGDPIDDLDQACYHHDVEYDKSYKEAGVIQRKTQHRADIEFVKKILLVARDKSQVFSVRAKAYIAAKYFVARISRCPLTPDLPNFI